MADNDGRSALLESTTPEQVLAAGGVSKRRRNLSNKSGERLRNPHSKSPKRRAGTPEPERRFYTDESEKDVSDSENLKLDATPKNVEMVEEEKKKAITPGRSRILVRTKDHGEIKRRTRSAERPPTKDTTTEIEDDFEIIRRMHKTKELEEEMKEAEKIKEEAKPKPKAKEEPKDFAPKEMPPLIIAPTELRKRIRSKTLTLPLQQSSGDEEKPKTTPRSKSKTRVAHRKVSTSEEEEDLVPGGLAVKGKLTLKPKKEDAIKAEPRKKRIIRRVVKAKDREDKRDMSESEGLTESEKAYDEPEGQEEDDDEEDKPEIIEKVEDIPEAPSKPWFFQRWFSRNKEEPPEAEKQQQQELKPEPEPVETQPTVAKYEEEAEEEAKEEAEDAKDFEEEAIPEVKIPEPEPKPERKRWLIAEIFTEWRTFAREHTNEYQKIKCLRNRCMSSLLLMLIYCGFGGMIFRFTEGAFESFYKCGVKRVKRDFIDTLWSNSQYMLEDDWKSQARRKLMEFENQLHVAHEAGMTTYSGQKSWSFLNSVVYCLTVVTTIGYGHISPSTATGRAITIIYAVFGIPMFLILLADFGKLFTRAIKFIWAFIRRLYYTGSCRKVRKTAPVQEVMKGVQLVYDFAKNRRPSQMPPGMEEEQQQQQIQLNPENPNVQISPETPGTPALSTFEIDDEFNLPISVAITILLLYIFVGATIYWMWEEWSFFESFYFVFISMSTIGFGDFVPAHPMFMMASILYLVFGLALTSMCINVVQEKLSDTFRQASVKIGTTIGLTVSDEEGPMSAPAELCDVKTDFVEK